MKEKGISEIRGITIIFTGDSSYHAHIHTHIYTGKWIEVSPSDSHKNLEHLANNNNINSNGDINSNNSSSSNIMFIA